MTYVALPTMGTYHDQDKLAHALIKRGYRRAYKDGKESFVRGRSVVTIGKSRLSPWQREA